MINTGYKAGVSHIFQRLQLTSVNGGGETRTHTGITPLGPKPSASTNSATPPYKLKQLPITIFISTI